MTLPDQPDAAPPANATDASAQPGIKAGARPDGTGYRAVLSEGDRTVWTCAHVHFTEHSAKADAEQHLKAMRTPT